ncbi:hypothetical protein J6590_035953, partial [Homalodisca vitripennis]
DIKSSLSESENTSAPMEVSNENIVEINNTPPELDVFDIDNLFEDGEQFSLPVVAEIVPINSAINNISEEIVQIITDDLATDTVSNLEAINKHSEPHLEDANDHTYVPGSSDSDEDDSNELNSNEKEQDAVNHSREVPERRQRANRGRADKKSWVAYSNKIKRMKGEEYKGRRRNEDGRTVFDVERKKNN